MTDEAQDPTARSLRLAWTNPHPPPPPCRPMDLARAIERHLAGLDGLTREQFLRFYAHGRSPGRA